MNFTKQGAIKAQRELVSKLPRNQRKLSVSIFKAVLVLILALVIIGVGVGFGVTVVASSVYALTQKFPKPGAFHP